MLANPSDEWLAITCRCLFLSQSFDSTTKLFMCKGCRKPSAVMLHRCTNCSCTFLKDFAHPRWRYNDPQCFDCLDADDSRATEIVLSLMSHRERTRLKPTLRHMYLHIVSPELLTELVFEEFSLF